VPDWEEIFNVVWDFVGLWLARLIGVCLVVVGVIVLFFGLYAVSQSGWPFPLNALGLGAVLLVAGSIGSAGMHIIGALKLGHTNM
jgi:hypothetical protein